MSKSIRVRTVTEKEEFECPSWGSKPMEKCSSEDGGGEGMPGIQRRALKSGAKPILSVYLATAMLLERKAGSK